MPRYMICSEVEAYATLSDDTALIRHTDPAGRYTAFVRNLRLDPNNPPPLVSVMLVFEAPSLHEASDVAEPYVRELLSFLSLVTSSKFRKHKYTHVFNWEPGLKEREALYIVNAGDAEPPISVLDDPLIAALSAAQQEATSPQIRRAIRWFANGVASEYADDQFTFFWQAIEVLSQTIKDPSRVPDLCPTCRGALYCVACEKTPMHRPYPKQAIRQIFQKYIRGDWERFYGVAAEVRNKLTHGEDLATIEATLETKLANVVDGLGHLAWASLLDQTPKALAAGVVSTNSFGRKKLSAGVHVYVNYNPDFDSPNPADFPPINIKFEFSTGPKPTSTDKASTP